MCGIAGFIKIPNNLSSDNLKKYSLSMSSTLQKEVQITVVFGLMSQRE